MSGKGEGSCFDDGREGGTRARILCFREGDCGPNFDNIGEESGRTVSTREWNG